MVNHAKITSAQSRLAMKWWNEMSIESRAYLRKTHRLHAVDMIARYWLSSVASAEESRIALRKEH